MNGILMVYLNRKSLIKWVICLWLVLLTKKTMILTNLKLLIYLLLVFLVLFREWWDSYLTEESKDSVKHAIKRNDEGLLIFYERIGWDIPDGVNTFIYTVLKHFVGTPTNVSSRISDYLNNLSPTMSNYRWYQDVFISRVMLQKNCYKPY